MLKNHRVHRFVAVISVFFVIAITASSVSAQLSGPKAIPGDYATVAAAVTDLNTQGVGAGGVTFTVADGHVETAPAGGFTITNPTGNGAGNPIVFQRGGGGARPSFTASAALTAGVLHDAIFEIIGTDNITIDGFEMLENAANTTTAAGTNNMTEWGVAILYSTTTNGSQNVTIQNCVIDLNRTYQNTFGIYSNSTHTSTTVTTSATATTTAGGNSGLKVYGNSITDVNMGVVIVGPTAAADANSGIDIGGGGGAQANSVTNYGTTGTFSGYANVSGTVNGILVRNSNGYNISFNTVNSSVGGVTAGTLNGIQIPAASSTPTGTFTNNINSNSISLQSGLAAGGVNGINQPSGSASTTSVMNINSNNFSTFSHTVAASGTITFITQSSAHLTHSIANNTFTNISVNTTGSVTLIASSNTLPTGGTKSISGNSIVTGFSKTGAGGTITGYTDNGSSPTGTTTTVTNNTFSNITVTGSTAVTGISDTDGGAPNKNVQNNTISNITGGLGTILGISVNFDGGTTTVSGNTISNISNGAAITGILTGTSGSGGALTTSISQNTIHTFTGTGTGTAVTGISLGGTTGHIKNVTRNKIYNLENNNSSGTVNGILQTSVPTANISNNLIGDLRTPAANAANPLIGINITGGTTVNADFNTVYLNGSSTGALFGSSAVSVSTTPTVTLRSNVFVNVSSTTGAGLAAAHRRSTTTLTSYAAASNNNDFFGSTVFTDGTNTDATLAAYKTRVASRDSNSVFENPPFLSTSGASANFLHISTVVGTQLESGGVTVAGITADYDGDTRNATTPDIGADEFAGILLDAVGPTITYTNLPNTSSNGDRVLSVTVTDPSGVPTAGVGLPVIYYRKNAGAYVSTQCTFVSGSNYNCSIVAAAIGGVTTGDIIGYYVAAQDSANNVSVNPSAGAAGLTANPPAAATPPTTPNTYTIVASITGTFLVGTGQTYTSLTNTGGIFEFINNSEVIGDVDIEITSDLTGELGTVALNEFAAGFNVRIFSCSAPRSVTGTFAGALIRLNGADNVTIDGNPNTCGGAVVGGNPALRGLTIQNTSTSTSAWVISVASNGTNGAQNNSVLNTNLIGQDPTTTAGIISIGGATPRTVATGPNLNNRVENCSLKRAITGIYSAGQSAASASTGTYIAENETSAVAADRIRRVGILLLNDNGAFILDNSLNGISTNESNDGIGIGVGTESVDTTSVTSGGVINAFVQQNKISGVASLSTTGFSAAGITVAGGTGGPNTVRNNMITGVTSVATSPDIVAGIYVVGATGSSTRLYHNSISMTGDRGTVNAQMPSYGVAITGADPTVELKNNIVYSTQTANCTTPCPTAESYGIGMVTTTFVNLDSNYNAFFTNSLLSQDGGYRSGSLALAAGTDYDTLAAWQAAVSDDANSQDINPIFIDAGADLHLNPVTSPLIGDGLTGFATVDHDNDPRPASAPEIGADELVQSEAGSFPAGIFYNAISAPGDQMAGSATITNSMTLNGILNTGNFNVLTMGCNATFANAGGGNYVVGTVNKQYCATGAFIYPVGTTPDNALSGGKGNDNGIATPEYTPVSVNVTGGTFPSFLSVRVFDATLIGFDPTQSLSRNWYLEELGDITADLSFTYMDGVPVTDVNGAEASYIVYRRNANGTTDAMCLLPCVDTVNNILGTVTGVTQFSRWSGAALVPTAAGVDVSGRVLTPNGSGLRNAIVTLTDSQGVTRTARSTSFGYYKFEDVRVGETYVINVNSKRYIFTPRTVQVSDAVTGLDMTADGEQ